MHNRMAAATISTRGLPVTSSGQASGYVVPITALSVAQMSGFDGLALSTAIEGWPVTVADTADGYRVDGLTEGAEYYVGLTGPVLLSSFAYGEATRRLGRVNAGVLEIEIGDVIVYGETDGANKVGNLASLTTTAKGSTVAAVNEVNALAGAAIPKATLTAANQVLIGTASATPAALDVAEGRVVGRKTGGVLDDLSAADLEGIIRAAMAVSTGNLAVNSKAITGLMPGAAAGEAVEYLQLGKSVDGAVGIVEGDYTGQPNAAETFTIGADVYEWDGAGANINVAKGGSDALSYAALATAINTLGTELVVADIPAAGRLRIRTAVARAGAVANSGASLAVSHTTTNLTLLGANMNQAGRATALRRVGVVSRTVDALFAAGAAGRVGELTWTPTRILSVQVLDTNGGPKYVTDRFTISGNAVVWTSNGATHIANTDVIRVIVEE